MQPQYDDHEEFLARKRSQRFEKIDTLPREVRDLVNEYSYIVVKTLLDLGVRKPNQIRHVVETVLDEFSPTRGSYAKQGIRTNVDRPTPSEKGKME